MSTVMRWVICLKKFALRQPIAAVWEKTKLQQVFRSFITSVDSIVRFMTPQG